MSFKITILGSSGALPAHGRFPSSQCVEIQNRTFLVDCGEGCQIQMMKYQVGFHRIDHILISHLHGDHYLGLMGLLFSMHLKKRVNDLHIYGMPGLDEIITIQLKHSRSWPSFRIHFHRLDSDRVTRVYEDDVLQVDSFPLTHRLPCVGFLFKEKKKPRRIDKDVLPSNLSLQQLAGLKKGLDVTDDEGTILYKNEQLTLEPRHSRSYAYCSDTAYEEGILDVIRGADVLYHEATFMTDEEDKAVETLHSTAAQAATIAKKAETKKLLLGHFSARYRELDLLLAEATAIFGPSELAIEGREYVLED